MADETEFFDRDRMFPHGLLNRGFGLLVRWSGLGAIRSVFLHRQR